MVKNITTSTKLAYILIFFLVLLYVPVVMGQTGIQIGSIEELQKIGNDPGYPLNGEYELIQDIDANDTVNWNDGAGFKPIGTLNNSFSGKFDGKGHKIINLYINRPATHYIGLFGYTGSGSEVKNLYIENCQIIGDSYVGGLVGKNEGTVSSSYSTGAVWGSQSVGGLVGVNWYATVSGCYSTGAVWGHQIIGGLIGNNWCGSVNDSYAMGSVRGSGYNIGGLIGYSYDCNITNTYSTGIVGDSGSNKGGLIGQSSGTVTITNSYWDVDTSGMSTSAGGEGKTTAEMKQQATYVGWDFTNVWKIEENASYPYLLSSGPTLETEPSQTVQIYGLDQLKKIGSDFSYPWWWNYELMVDIDASETGNWYSGKGFKPIQLTGKFDGKEHKIQNLYINRPDEDNVAFIGRLGPGGEVKDVGIENCQITGGGYVGSLVGYIYTGTVSGSYSSGAVWGYHTVGGLMGSNGGTVSDSYSMCLVSGIEKVGGLVGCNNGTVSSCYSTGLVSSVFFVGGLIGYNFASGTVISSYWDIETSGQSSSSGGTGKTTAEMKQQATYVGWDFTNVWAIKENESYPYLIALGTALEPEPSQTVQIDSLEELQKIGLDPLYPWWWNYELIVDIDASETLNWNEGKGFKPIQLIGKFDGKGHKIQNLYINRPDEDYVGFISRLGAGGEVKDIGIESCQIIGYFNIGGLVGQNNGTVSNTYIMGSVSGNEYVGGLVGWNNGTVSNSYSSGTVGGVLEIGGLVGWNKGTLSGAYSTVSVSGSYNVGGLLGYNYGTVINSYAMGSVTGSVFMIGGLIGFLHEGNVVNTYSIGSVGGDGNNKGGLIGYNYLGTVTNSYWDTETSGMSTSEGGEGKTTAEMKQQATFVGWDFTNVWGIVELGSYPYLLWQGGPLPIQIDSIEELQLIGNDPNYPSNMSYELSQDIDANATVGWDSGAGFNPIGTSSNPFTGKFDGKGHKIIGLYINRQSTDYIGLFGKVSSGGEIKNLGIEDSQIFGREYVGCLAGSIETGSMVSGCYSTGIVRGNGWYVGGFAGRNYSGTVSDCYSTGPVQGDSYVGGLIGYNYGMVSRCYSTGTVSGNSYVGGLLGYKTISSSVLSCYWDIETSGQNSSAGGTGKTTAEMIQQATFSGWDFTDVWGINEDASYPYLLWQGGPLFVFVPDVEGLSQSDAESAITGAGLTVGMVNQECNDTVPAGKVISQDPLYGQQVPPGTAVNLVVSTGPCSITVPDVTGTTEHSALGMITGVGLTMGTVSRQCSDTVPEGIVISQDPIGGEQVPPGTAVNLVVSTGPCHEGEGIPEGEGAVEGEGVVEGIPEGEGTAEGTIEGIPEGTPEGTVEGVTEGTIEGEGTVEGTPEGSIEGEGAVEGTPEGEGAAEGIPEGTPEGEGIVEGAPEGEGTAEGITEGIVEGAIEGEGIPEGTVEGEGLSEGEGSAEGEKPPHSADPNGDGVISLSELLRVIQFFNTGGYHCEFGSEDGYAPGIEGDQTCTPHASDYNEQDWIISLSELLRLIQFFNYGGYHSCPDGEDGYCPGL